MGQWARKEQLGLPRSLAARVGVSLFAISGGLTVGATTSWAAFTESSAAFGVASGDSMSYAAGFVDYDGDDDPDFFSNHHYRSAFFFRNDGGSFSDVGSYLVGQPDRHDQHWADFDNDGDPDQYLSHGGGQDNELYWNQGLGVLLEDGVVAGVDDRDGRGREVAIADWNNDGYLDIFVSNDFRSGFPRPNALFWNDGDGTFTRAPNATDLFRSRQHVASVDFDSDGLMDLILSNPPWADGELYRNNGDSTFTEVTSTAFAGITDPLLEAQGMSWADYDNDGDLDLLACGGNRGMWDYAEIEADSIRFHAEAPVGTFKEFRLTTDGDSVTLDVQRSTHGVVTMYLGGSSGTVSSFPTTMAVSDIVGAPSELSSGVHQGMFVWAQAGTPDTVHVSMGGEGSSVYLAGGSLRASGSGVLSLDKLTYSPKPGYAYHDWSNRLFRNDGGTFAEVTSTAFAANGSAVNSNAAAWGDYDNDGWIDVFIANGGTIEVGNQPNYLLRNQGDGTFVNVAAAEGVEGPDHGLSDGAAWADVNEDGFLDLLVENGAEHPPFGVGPRELFVNADNGNHWVSVRLRGIASNGSGIGATVRVVTTGGSQWRTRLGNSDNGFTNDHALHFGLGSATVVDTMEVSWPSGQVDQYVGTAVDQSFVAVEGSSLRPTLVADFSLATQQITDTLEPGQVQNYEVAVDNTGGLATECRARVEDCSGAPISWLSVSPESSSVFPGGAPPIEIQVDTATLGMGSHCARVVFDTQGAPDTLDVAITVQSIDLAVSHSVSDTAPAEGDSVTFGVVVSNGGPASATGVEISYELPSVVSVLSSTTSRGAYSDSTGTWSVGSLAAAAADTLSILAVVDAGAAGASFVSTASIAAVDQQDGDSSNDSDSIAVSVPGADVSVLQSVSDSTPEEGDTVQFTIVVTNTGPDDAVDVVVTDPLPLGVTFVSSVSSRGSYVDSTGIWALDSLSVSATDSLSISVTVDSGTAGSTIENVAQVSAASPADPDPSNNADSASVTVELIPTVDLALTKAVDDATPNESDTIQYTIVLSNSGPDIATNVAVTDSLPLGVTFVSSVATRGAYVDSTGLWSVDSLAVAGADTLTITATVDTGTEGSTIENVATISSVDQVVVNAADDADSASVTVELIPTVDLALSKAVDDATPNESDTLQYTIVLSNVGPDIATNVAVTDSLPLGVTFVSSVATRGAYVDSTGLWSVDSMAVAGADTLTITATVDTGTEGSTIENVATISSVDQVVVNAADDADSASVTVELIPTVDLALTKAVDDATPNESDTIQYTLVLSNSGPDIATNVAVTDSLPLGVTFVSSVATRGAYVDSTGLWSVDSMAVAGADTLTITATVDTGTEGSTIENVATISSVDQVVVNPADDADSASVTVELIPTVDLALTKAVDDATPNESDTIQYTLVLSNAGPDIATNVAVTDSLPLGVTFVSSVATRGAYVDSTGLWSVDSLAVAAADTLTITATIDTGTEGSTIENVATISSVDQVVVNAADDADSASVTVELIPTVDLALTKAVDDATPNESDTIQYTLVLSNAGPDIATNVTVTDSLPLGVTFVSSVATRGAYVDSTGLWSVDSMAVAGADTLTITATVDAGTEGSTIENVATISSVDQVVVNAADDADSATVTVELIPAVDLALTKAVDAATPNESDTIQYTIVLSNAGPDIATNVTVTDSLPLGVTFVSSVATRGAYVNSTGLWSVDSLAVAGADTLTITATIDAGTEGSTIENVATISSVDQVVVNAADDADSASVTVELIPTVDLALTKAVDDATPNESDTIQYTLVLSNSGPDIATNVAVTDSLPLGVTFVSSVATRGAYVDSTGLWSLDSLAVAGADTLTITATVDTGTEGSTIENVATISSVDQVVVNAADDADSASVTVELIPTVDLALTKAVDDATPNESDTIQYTLVLSNAGPDIATNVTVTDSLPLGVTFVSSVATRGAYVDSTGLWSVDSLAVAGADTLTITATVDAGTAGGTIVNLATITDRDQVESDPANDADFASLTVELIPTVDLALTKAVDDATPNESDTIQYTIVLSNAGPDIATNVAVTDSLPLGVTFVSSVATRGAYVDSTGLWSVDSMAVAGADTLTITATVDAGTAGGTIVNLATITDRDQVESDPANDADFASLTVELIPTVDLALTKAVDSPTANEGDTIQYTIVLSNAGPDIATNVAVTDSLPVGVTFVSSVATRGAYVDSTGLWAVDSLAVAGADTLTITATVDSATVGSTIVNLATIAHRDQVETDPSNDADFASLTVELTKIVDLVVAQTVDDATPSAGAVVTYTIVVSNDGPEPASGVTLTDALPTGLTFLASNSTQGRYDEGTSLWTVGDVASAAADTLTISAGVDLGSAGLSITNTALVASVDQLDGNTANDSASVTIDVSSTALSAGDLGVPLAFQLSVPRPNPSRTESRIELAIPREGPAVVTIYDVTGRQVRTLFSEVASPGYHSLVWNGRNERGSVVAAGVYFIRATSLGERVTRKLIRLD